MNIKPAVYEHLTPPQRVLATLEAKARGDKGEADHLMAACPIKPYRMTDLAYADTIKAIEYMTLYVENTLCGHSLYFAFFGKNKSDDCFVSLRYMLTLHTAWREALEAHGLDPDMVGRAFGLLQHPIMRYFLESAYNILDLDTQEHRDYEAAMGKPWPFDPSPIAPNPDDVAAWRDKFTAILQKAAQV